MRLPSAVIGFLFIFACNSFAIARTPEELITTFYKWYITQSGQGIIDKEVKLPLRDDEIFRFVSKKTILRLREDFDETPEGEVGKWEWDYFMKSQDFDAKDWSANVRVKKLQYLLNFALAEVVLGSSVDFFQRVIVIMRMEDGDWVVFKVFDTDDWTE